MNKILSFICFLLFTTSVFSQTISSFSPSRGAVGTLVTINGTGLSNPTSFTIGGKTALVISNTGTVLTGFVMPGAATGTVSVTTESATATSSANFTVIPTPYPSTQQGDKLVGSGYVGSAQQGYSVAVSADGNTAIVGGRNDNSNMGAAWIYTRTNGAWTQQGDKLVGTGNQGKAYQSKSVSINADGNTVAVGGYVDNSNQGAVWIFTRSEGIWMQQGNKLVGTGNIGAARQGYFVVLSADGNTLISSGYRDNSYQGAIWIFTRSGNSWTQQGSKLVGTGSIGAASQGYSAALSADGNTAAIGGYNDNSSQGAVWIFTRSEGAWTQQGSKLIGTGNIGNAAQGFSVALSADGNTLISGGYPDNSSQGACWIFTRSEGAWSQQGNKLVGTGNVGPGSQGSSVTLSADGTTAIIGAYRDNSYSGAAWVFTMNGGIWTQQGNKFTGSDLTGAARFGVSVSLSADGSTAISGGYTDNSLAGAAWVFVPAPLSANANLSGLSVSAGDITPVFDSATISYTISVADTVASATVTPAVADTTATVTVNGVTVSQGNTSEPIMLNVGSNTITVVVTAQDGTTQKTYTITVTRAQGTLPVTLTAFNAYRDKSTVEVTWKTAGEINIDKYIIERSNAGTNYAEVGEVIAKGNSSTDVVYSWTDNQPLSGNNFYRLKTIDKDGTVKYSEIKAVNFSLSGQYLQVVPNPVINKTIRYILGNVAAGKYQVALYDKRGRKVFSNTIIHDGVSAIKTIHLNGLSATGMYHLSFANSTLKLNEAVMIK